MKIIINLLFGDHLSVIEMFAGILIIILFMASPLFLGIYILIVMYVGVIQWGFGIERKQHESS